MVHTATLNGLRYGGWVLNGTASYTNEIGNAYTWSSMGYSHAIIDALLCFRDGVKFHISGYPVLLSMNHVQ